MSTHGLFNDGAAESTLEGEGEDGYDEYDLVHVEGFFWTFHGLNMKKYTSWKLVRDDVKLLWH